MRYCWDLGVYGALLRINLDKIISEMYTNSREAVINISKFKEWVFSTLSTEEALYRLMQREKDEMTLEEAIAKTGIIVTLIESSIPKE